MYRIAEQTAVYSRPGNPAIARHWICL